MRQFLLALFFIPTTAIAELMIAVDNSITSDLSSQDLNLAITNTPTAIGWSYIMDSSYHFKPKLNSIVPTQLCTNLKGSYIISYSVGWTAYPTDGSTSTVQTYLFVIDYTNTETAFTHEPSITIESVIYGGATNLNTAVVELFAGSCVELRVEALSTANDYPLTITPERVNLVIRN